MTIKDIPTIDLLAELDRRAAADAPPSVEFYGVWPGQHSGHYLRNQDGENLWSKSDKGVGRGRAYLYPWDGYRGKTQNEGKLWHWHHPTEPITLLMSWDRSADSRGNCCASFIVRSHVTPERALALARSTFPAVFERIESHLGRPTELAGPVPT